MSPIARLIVVGLVATIAFPLSLWLAETFHMDCTRQAGDRFDCVVESTKRGSTRLFKLDHTMLREARMDTRTVHHSDGSFDERYALQLVLAGGNIASSDGDPGDIGRHVTAINAFLHNAEPKTLRFTMSNRTSRLLLAAMLVAFALAATHRFH